MFDGQVGWLTGVLQLGGVLLHLVLRATVRDGDDHLGNVPSHAIVRGEHLLIHMLQGDT